MSDASHDALPARALLAEFIGTFALVFAGCGAIMSDATSGGALGHVGVCLTFGLVVAAMIFATGHVSGAHLNPAVTIAFAATGAFPWRKVPGYVVTQAVAATLASFALSGLLGQVASIGATSTSLGLGAAFALEAIMTFFLMFVITSVATDVRAQGHHAAVAIGATVALCALFGGPLTGASMNPARSLGPALAASSFQAIWLYLSAPVVGAVAGALAYQRTR